uniref:Stomatin-like protein 1 isoform X2 n=1 Tax=Geotrypetes seraphini TaxID=260995 RepID=A0A6P8PM43_GEOSA|nr:stomatin-like protein 1 isoform X2 [Geotrypetes seraphini]
MMFTVIQRCESFHQKCKIEYESETSRSKWHIILIGIMGFITIVMLPLSGWFAVKKLKKNENIVVRRLGTVRVEKKPGFIFLLPFLDDWHRIYRRTQSLKIPSFQVPTKEGMLIVKAEVVYKIYNPVTFVMAVKNLTSFIQIEAERQMMRMFQKKLFIDLVFEEQNIKEKMLAHLQKQANRWGVHVSKIHMGFEPLRENRKYQAESPSQPEESSNFIWAEDSCGMKNEEPNGDKSRKCISSPCYITIMALAIILLIVTFPISIWFLLKRVKKHEGIVIHRLGRMLGAKGPRWIILVPIIDKLQRVDLWIQPLTVPSIKIYLKTITTSWRLQIHQVEIDYQPVLKESNLIECSGSRIAFENEEDSPPTLPSPVSSPGVSEHKKTDHFISIESVMEDLVYTVGLCFQFEITSPGKPSKKYFLDLTKGNGNAGEGCPNSTPDVILELSEDSLRRMLTGDLSLYTAFLTEKIHISGDISDAVKLYQVFRLFFVHFPNLILSYIYRNIF